MVRRVAVDPEYKEFWQYDSHSHSHKRKSLSYSNVCIENMLEGVRSYMYLGFAITRDFRWDTHVKNVVKASTQLPFLKWYLKHASQQTKLQACETLIRS